MISCGQWQKRADCQPRISGLCTSSCDAGWSSPAPAKRQGQEGKCGLLRVSTEAYDGMELQWVARIDNRVIAALLLVVCQAGVSWATAAERWNGDAG